MFDKPPRFGFRTGIPDATLFPYQSWRRLLVRQLRPAAVGLGAYGDPAGHPGLRQAIARHIGLARGVQAGAEEVVVTNGTQQAVDVVARVLLAPGDRVAVESPGYGPPRRLMASLGPRCSGFSKTLLATLRRECAVPNQPLTRGYVVGPGEEEAVKVRAAQATTIVLFALVMGVFWGTWFSLSRTMSQLSAETFLAVGHEMIQNLGMPMAILLPLALLSALVTLALLWPGGRGAAFWWMAAGLLLMVAALVITLSVEVPIDNQIQDWTAATLPADWRSIQSRWELFHTIRTFTSIAALIAVTISATIAAPPNRPARNEAGPGGRVVAGA